VQSGTWFIRFLFKSNSKYSLVVSLGVYQPQDGGNPTGCTIDSPITGGNVLANFSALSMFRDLFNWIIKIYTLDFDMFLWKANSTVHGHCSLLVHVNLASPVPLTGGWNLVISCMHFHP
jgi:hypothetical protein